MYRYLILALALTGCALPPSTFTRPADLYNPPEEYAYYYDALYADFFWRCVTPERGGVRVEGYAVSSLRNNIAILDFEVRLFALDAKGNILGDRWTYGDRLSPSNLDPVPFAITVPAAADVVRYDLYYYFEVPEWHGNNGGDGGAQGRPRIQRVRVVLASMGLDYFGTIEDVCGGRWQRKLLPPAS